MVVGSWTGLGSDVAKGLGWGFRVLLVFWTWAVGLAFFVVARLVFIPSQPFVLVASPVPSAHCTPNHATTTVNRIAGDHLPSSAPPNGESSLSSGERLRLRPRGLVFGAATVDDGGITRKASINVSHGVVRGGGTSQCYVKKAHPNARKAHSNDGARNVQLPWARSIPTRWTKGSNYPECSTLPD